MDRPKFTKKEFLEKRKNYIPPQNTDNAYTLSDQGGLPELAESYINFLKRINSMFDRD